MSVGVSGIVIPDEEIDFHWVGQDGKPNSYFNNEYALAALLLADKVFINSRRWKDHDKDDVGVGVNCNDVFAWGCGDAEDLPYDQIETVWRMWHKDPDWGTAIWCIQKRKEMPQKPVEDHIRKAGIWDLDSMGLEPNTTDARVKALIAKAAAEGKI